MTPWLANRIRPIAAYFEEETMQAIPNLKEEGLKGGVIYHDGQFDDARARGEPGANSTLTTAPLL